VDRIDDLLLQHPAGAPRAQRRFWVGLARTPQTLRAAQQLRWRVFAEELGARLDSREPGIDRDLFDAHCEHLVVRDDETGEVVGTYRLLAPEAARRPPPRRLPPLQPQLPPAGARKSTLSRKPTSTWPTAATRRPKRS